jgi:phage-related minor tail protein
MALSIPIISEFNGKGIDKAIKEFKQLEGAGKKAQFALKKAALPAIAALGALGLAAKGAIAAGEAAATANARIAQINESMGLFGDTTDNVNKRLIDYANATARATGVDQNSIKATQAKLLTFKELAQSADNVGGAFDRATKAAIDMAAAGFGDAEANAVQLGKALNDPIKGITALAKSGVTFTAQEKEKIKTLVESNKTLEAQQLILAAIETQVGGTAEATANDSDKMKVAFSQVSESIGIILLPMFQKLSAILVQVADFAVENSKVMVILGGVVGGLAVAILAANAAMKVYQATLIVVKAAQFALNLVMAANPITLVVLALAALVAAFVLAYKNSETFRNGVNALFDGIKKGVTASVDFIKGYLNVVMNFYKSIFNGIASLWNNSIGKLSFSVPDWVPGLGGKGFDVPNIPMLADGGIVQSPTLALIGEKGPEAVVPLNRAGGFGGGYTINITGGLATSADIGRAVVNSIKAMNRVDGPAQIQVA